MRSEIRTAFAVLATAAVLLSSATMALAADADSLDPGPALTTTAPSPSASTSEPTAPNPSATTPDPSPTVPPAPSPSPSTDPTPTPEPTPEVPTGAFMVSDAQVRWGVNDESNNKAFAPGTYNFFSAGKIANPGRGNVALPESGWRQADGHVTIEKFLNGAWTPATYRGLSRDSSDALMTTTNGPFSNHEVVISGGKGTVDPTKGNATIQWMGSFTVLYYSGYSFFYVTDPKLTVTGGTGTLTGTLSGYSSSMEDLEKWEAVPPVTNVVLADLGAVDLAKDLGFSATPAYVGVNAPAGAGQAPKTPENSRYWGSFPQSFVNYQTTSGTGAYWYSSGGAADAHKVAKPVTISYAAGAPVKVTPPLAKKSKTTKVKNDAPEAPASSPRSAPAASPPLNGLPAEAPLPAEALLSTPALTQFRPASTVTGTRALSESSTSSSTGGIWILGGVLLGSSLLVAAGPFAYSALRKAN